MFVKKANVEICIDNKEIGIIHSGEAKEFEIAAGDYILNGKMNWIKTRDVQISISDNETKVYLLKIRNSKPAKIIRFLALISASAFFIVNYYFKNTVLNLIVCIPICFYLFSMLYQISINRNKFMEFAEVK